MGKSAGILDGFTPTLSLGDSTEPIYLIELGRNSVWKATTSVLERKIL